MTNTMRQFEIELEGRIDKGGKDYYVAVTKIPVNVDLSDAVILIFPWEGEGEDKAFGAKLMIKKFQPRKQRSNGHHRQEPEIESEEE